MKKVVKESFIAKDGKEFASEEECRSYEIYVIGKPYFKDEPVGPKAFASLDEDGILTICGEGSISNPYANRILKPYKNSIKKIIIKDGIVAIRNEVFLGFTEVEKVVIPETVKTIGRKVFFGCKNLIELVIPGSVESIDYRAFERCHNLKRIVFEEGVKTTGCSEVTDDVEIYLPISIRQIELYTYNRNRNITVHCYPQNVAAVKWASEYAKTIEYLGEDITEEQLDNLNIDYPIDARALLEDFYMIAQNNASEGMAISWDMIRYVIKKHQKGLAG